MQSTKWCFTLNNYTLEEVVYVREEIMPTCKYGIIGEERAPETGTQHLQGFLIFKSNQRFKAVHALIPRAHWELAKGSPEQNKTYCSKEGMFYEHGECPITKGEGEKRRWTDALASAKAGEFDNIPADIYMRQYNTIKRIHLDHGGRAADLTGPCGTWICGLAGSGKSFRARQLGGDSFYVKPLNKWWDGYKGEDTVIIDDVDPTHKWISHFLKVWADQYAFVAEEKGASRSIRPKRLIVTSQYPLTAVFEDVETQEALLRRFQVQQWSKEDRVV